jgi:hypothetical protein
VVLEGLPEDYASHCGTDCVELFEQGSGHQVTQFGGDKTHYVVLEDVKGSTVTIDFGSFVTDFEEFLPEAKKVVESVKWGDS